MGGKKVDGIIMKIKECVIAGDEDSIIGLIDQALDASVPVNRIMAEGLTDAMNVVGKQMECGDMFIPEVLMCAETMKVGMDYLKPKIGDAKMNTLGKIVIGTVQGDLHDIGKNLIKMMFEVSGFQVIDLGIDQAPDRFLEIYKKEKPDIIGLSALLTTTMVSMQETVELLRKNDVSAKIIVGGAPVTAEFAKTINADGYSDDAGGAISLCKKLLNIA